jgi:hypothetical protein
VGGVPRREPGEAVVVVSVEIVVRHGPPDLIEFEVLLQILLRVLKI